MFRGWGGLDPDIPPLLAELSAVRSISAPIFWIHYHGSPPKEPRSLDVATEGIPTQLRKFASDKPILADADRFFGGLLNWMGVLRDPNPGFEAMIPDFSQALRHCSRSGLARFIGIALRRADKFRLASEALEVAKELAGTAEERAAATQEIALLSWARNTGGDKTEARRLVQKASNAQKSSSDLLASLNTDFGLLSMTVLALKSRPWLILRIPELFRRYERHIQQLKNESTSKESVALHESLLHLYRGRFRLELFGWMAVVAKPISDWILRPFDIARNMIDGARDIHLHSRIDVLSTRAIALARFGHCQDAWKDVPEIGRLIAVLKDEARANHWKKQRQELEYWCPRDKIA